MGLFRLVGIAIVSASLLYFGYDLYTNDLLKADCNRRLHTLWNQAATKYPVLAEHHAKFSEHSQHILAFVMWALLCTPVIIFCRQLTFFTLVAYG